MAIGDLSGMRVPYAAGLLESDLAPDPLTQFLAWLEQVRGAGQPEPNAMVLATAAPEGPAGRLTPTARHVLLKQVGAEGFTFFTNLGSRKARQIEASPGVALVFPWFAAHRQVVVEGLARPVPREEAGAYFASRPYGARIGAWASVQSEVLASRDELEQRYRELESRFPDTGSPQDVPLPEHWGGLLVRPLSVEFWAGRPSRLHDRLRFRSVTGEPGRLDDPAAWTVERLNP